MKKITTKPNDYHLQCIDNIKYKTDVWSKEFNAVLDRRGINYLQTSDAFSNDNSRPYYYKYMDLESAIRCLKNGNIRFVEPTRWNDKFEGRLYRANYSNVCTSKDQASLLYACCLSQKARNEAAWKIYTHGKTGLGVVTIIPNDRTCNKSALYTKDGKRVYGGELFVSIDWAEVIEEILYDSECSEIEAEILTNMCQALLSRPKYQSLSDKDRKLYMKKITPKKQDIYGKRQTVTIERP